MKTKLFLLGFGLAMMAQISSCGRTDDCEASFSTACLAHCVTNPTAAGCTSQIADENLIETDSTAAVAKLPVRE